MNSKDYISVFFDDEVPMLEAIRTLSENKKKILDVMSPFPVHGIDEALSFKRTRIPVGGFIFGTLGALLAFSFQAWVFTVSYPLIIGGKPFFSIPTFVPITFEVTVLFSGLAMAAALLIRSGLKPDISFEALDERITDDKFVVLVGEANEEANVKNIASILSGIHTMEIR